MKDDEERTYALDRIVEQTTNVPGEVTQLNVAVLMDETAVTDEQAATIKEMVSTAAGIDPERGDSIVVTRMPFDTSASAQADELAAADEKAASKEQMMGMVRTIAVLLVILIALFLGYRSAKHARKVTATPINIGEIGSSGPRDSDARRRIDAAGHGPRGARDVGPDDADRAAGRAWRPRRPTVMPWS